MRSIALIIQVLLVNMVYMGIRQQVRCPATASGWFSLWFSERLTRCWPASVTAHVMGARRQWRRVLLAPRLSFLKSPGILDSLSSTEGPCTWSLRRRKDRSDKHEQVSHVGSCEETAAKLYFIVNAFFSCETGGTKPILCQVFLFYFMCTPVASSGGWF